MKTLEVLLVVLLAMARMSCSTAFVPNTSQTRERRPAFSTVEPKEEQQQQQRHLQQPMVSSTLPGPSPASATSPNTFALPPIAVTTALTAAYEEQGEDEAGDVSYGIALVSCVLSLALGFGIGYGV
jgi:hypothetical protein